MALPGPGKRSNISNYACQGAILRIKQRERASKVNASPIIHTLSGELRCRLFTRVGIARGDVDLGAILDKASGDHEANASRTTGNEDYLALELVENYRSSRVDDVLAHLDSKKFGNVHVSSGSSIVLWVYVMRDSTMELL